MIADQLKRAVLQAAIQGKLTGQLPEDGDARELLEEIRAEKERLIKEGEIKKGKTLPEISEDQIPFDIPDNWCWVRLANLTAPCDYPFADGPFGSNLKREHYTKEPEVRIIQLSNIGENGWRDDNIKYTTIKHLKSIARSEVSPGDIVIAKMMPAGRAIIVPMVENKYVLSSDAIKFVPNKSLNQKYLLLAINNEYFRYQINSEVHGVTRIRTSLGKIKSYIIPLPPLAEQHRIVEKLEEILSEIDTLRVDENKLDSLQQSFPGQMKSSILQAAMQGRLTEQLPEDGNALDLLEEIKAEKEQLIKEGKSKKEKPLPQISEDDIPFDIPDDWCWVRLGEITFNRGMKKPNKEFTYIDISSIDNKKNQLGVLTNILLPQNAPSRARKMVDLGDVIYATVRPYLHNICMIDRIIDPEPIVSTGFAVVSSINVIVNKFLFWCFLTPMFDDYANDNENAKGVAYPAINNRKFLNAPIPLPPLAEQHRIVARLEALLPLCDTLE